MVNYRSKRLVVYMVIGGLVRDFPVDSAIQLLKIWDLEDLQWKSRAQWSRDSRELCMQQ